MNIIDTLQYQYWRYRQWRDLPKWMKPGVLVCCCDLRHRTIKRIETGDVEMTDGYMCSAFHCGLEQVGSNGECSWMLHPEHP